MDPGFCITLSLMADTKRQGILAARVPQTIDRPAFNATLSVASFVRLSFVHVSTSLYLGAHSQKKKKRKRKITSFSFYNGLSMQRLFQKTRDAQNCIVTTSVHVRYCNSHCELTVEASASLRRA
jgi:hypothetical protein